MSRVTRTLLYVALFCIAASAACAKPQGGAGRAEAAAMRVLDALGGRERFAELRGLRWSFGSSVNDTVRSTRRHAWDKHSGWHKVTGVGRDGVPFTIVHVLGDSTQGWATLGTRPMLGDSLRQMLRRGQGMWTNDSYWFLMPYKLLDPGVQLADLGDTTIAGARHQRIGLSFGSVGLTPGDRYTVFVDTATWRVTRWTYVLEGQQPPPVEWSWEGWQQHAALWFPTQHRAPAGSPRAGTTIFTDAVEAVREFPAGEFRAP